MLRGYFAGVIVGLYRETQDGKVVTSRRVPPLYRRRWYYVETSQRAAFEKRAIRAHVIAMGAVGIASQFVVDRPVVGLALMIGILTLVVLPVLQAWMTSGLVEASVAGSLLSPRSRAEQSILHSRALGVRTLWGFVALGIVLSGVQVAAAVVEGVWWAWIGAVIFGSITLHFVHQILRLRAAGVAPRTT